MMIISPFTIRIIFISFFIFYIPAYANQPDADCISWLKAGKIATGTKTCILNCAALMTDMGTFVCPNQCDLLCKNTEDSLTAFIQKTRAEWSSGRNFPEQGLNDEGDAFRHFIWAGLLTKELGTEKAKDFLNAHEANPLQPESERDMDKFNNEKGHLAAQNLKVLVPGLKIPEEPK